MCWYGMMPSSQSIPDDFYNRFKDEALALDQWFMLQAAHPKATAETIKALTEHADYDLKVPNRIRAVSGGLNANPVNTWSFVYSIISSWRNIWIRKTRLSVHVCFRCFHAGIH